jgi:DNA-binding NarL/FixJ family response regulator
MNSAKLSPQQTIIMQALVDGFTIKEIAYLMRIKKVTVRKYVTNVKKKLGARTQDRAIALSVVRGDVIVALDAADPKLTA